MITCKHPGDNNHQDTCPGTWRQKADTKAPQSNTTIKYAGLQICKFTRVAFVESRYCLTVQSACLRLCLGSSCLILKQHAVHPRCAPQDCCMPPTSPSNFHHRGQRLVFGLTGVKQQNFATSRPGCLLGCYNHAGIWYHWGCGGCLLQRDWQAAVAV